MSNQRPPNIIVVMADDHGPWAAHCLGTKVLHTPNMDYLAKTGARMSQASTPSPVCSPARASFFTGQIPSQHGVHDWIHEHQAGRNHRGLDGQMHIGHWLQQAGYHTALIGKWHCGRSRQPKSGFNRWFSYWGDQYPHFGEQHFSDQGNHVIESGRQSTLLTNHAIDHLRQRCDECHRDQPFFAFVGLVDTHSPFKDHPAPLVEHYLSQDLSEIVEEPIDSRHAWVKRGLPDEPALRRQWLAEYLASVTQIDMQLGRMIDELDALGELDRTLIVYTSDHGHMNGHHGLYCKGNATFPQNFYDESIQVPCLLRLPGVIDAGETHVEPVDHCDLFCTLLDAANARLDAAGLAETDTPGRSYLPLLKPADDVSDESQSRAAPWRDAQFCEYGNARMIRTPQHKLIKRWRHESGDFPNEFYDMQADPRERDNRIDDPAHASTIADLSQRLHAHFTRYAVDSKSGLKVDAQAMHNGTQAWNPRPEN